MRDIINKMVASTITFSYFGRRERLTPALDLENPVEMIGEDPLGVFLEAAAECRAVWRTPGAFDGTAPSTVGDFPAKAVLNARIFDTTILSWDVATACGLPDGINDDLAGYVLRVARALVPTVRRANVARYKDPTDLGEGAPIVEQMIAATGRNVHRQPPTA